MSKSQDEFLASVRDGLPPMWFAIYQGCIATGFDERQSFALLQTYLLSQNPNGIRPPDEAGPSSNKE